MPGYPYSVPFPGGRAWRDYCRKYNTRIIPHIYFGNGDLRTYPRAEDALTSACTR